MRRASAALVILGGWFGGPALAASGGPDTYGYTWRDSAEPGVVFAWEDISATGMDITISEDDANTGFLPLTFGFPYYGVSYSRIAACTNGWVSPVDAVSEEWGNVPLPDPFEPMGTIAAHWDDLDLFDAGRMVFADLADRAVVTWEDVPYIDGTGPGTFQVVLHRDGRIVVQYLDVADRGSATVGIESPDDTDGLTAWDGVPLPGVSYAIWFEPPVPVPVDLDCAGATPLACGARITGDTRSGAANQDAYRCAPGDWSGRETVHVLDVPAGGSVRLGLESLSGDQALIVVSGCDPNACVARAGDDVTLVGVSGTVQVVVDSPPGMEGSYAITVECSIETLPFCGGPAPELLPDGWGDGTGSWLVEGWLYHPSDTHNFALRVDGGTTYEHDGFDCPDFLTLLDTGVTWPAGPAHVSWGAPEGTVEMRMGETTAGGCCGLLVTIEVTNTDVAPHSYEFRVYHDTAFGDEDPAGACGGAGVVDGGEIEVMGTRYGNEVELLPLGGDTCEGQVRMFSADFPTELRASYEMLGPNTPIDMELVNWLEGGEPCTDWSDLVDGSLAAGCNDNALLLIWRFPQGAGTLAPGESATAQYRIGWNCAWPCGVACESPVLPPATAVDVGPCNDGIEVGWAAATFPGAGNGVYHVYRSDSSFVDALAQPPLTGPTGTTDTRFVDDTTLPGTDYYYVIQAESTDFPGCGAGPLVAGSTAEAQAGPVRDDADLSAPVTEVGNALRAVGHTDVTVDFTWPTAPALGANESYVILRSDDRPQGPFSQAAGVAAPAWNDPDAPPRYSPTHVWFYDVRIADSCGNLSRN